MPPRSERRARRVKDDELRTADGLLAAFAARSPDLDGAAPDDLRRVLEAGFEVGHQRWPLRLRDLLPGRDVLDMGSGHTFDGAIMRALGARSYMGVEPRLDWGRDRWRSKRDKARGSVGLGLTLADVTRMVPGLAYSRPGEVDLAGRFDLAAMHMVTEHLLDIDAVLAQTAEALRPGGLLCFLHDNFAAWGGHHMAPRSPRSYDPADPAQAAYADWRHLRYRPGPGHPFVTNLNRIRLDALRAATERHFEVQTWKVIRDERNVALRLTPEIEAGLPDFERSELLTRHVLCIAARR